MITNNNNSSRPDFLVREGTRISPPLPPPRPFASPPRPFSSPTQPQPQTPQTPSQTQTLLSQDSNGPESPNERQRILGAGHSSSSDWIEMSFQYPRDSERILVGTESPVAGASTNPLYQQSPAQPSRFGGAGSRGGDADESREWSRIDLD